jgi:hypothetical protein
MNRSNPFRASMHGVRHHGFPAVVGCIGCVTIALLWSGESRAQFGGFGGGFGGVGGISIDADGIVRNLDPEAVEKLAVERQEALAKEPARPTAGGAEGRLRKVSLAGIVGAMKDAAATGKPLPPEVLFIGGLERITHVFVDPERRDIVLAGPADTAAVDATGNVVAAASGRPLLQLEDFVVALRSIDAARAGGMQCSIDPTPEGLVKLRAFLQRQKTMGSDPNATLQAMEDELGPQRVTIGGVPTDSRFARVLVAADYRLKRIGMGLESSGIKELPSYLEMVPPGVLKSTTLPRFWLEASYDPIARDAEELAWQITGRRMECHTENSLFGPDGKRLEKDAARVVKTPEDRFAAKWCEAMTAQYEPLAVRQPVFAELLNCVDLAVVAALIHGRQLGQRAGLDLAPLLDADAVKLPTYEVPESVSSVATGIKKGNRWIVSASGGVQFQPWQFATNTAESADAAAERMESLASRPDDAARWWWD